MPGLAGFVYSTGKFLFTTTCTFLAGVLAASLASPAEACTTKEVAVFLPHDDDPDIILYPMCTTAHRCGGCCVQEQNECSPTSASFRTVSVRLMTSPVEVLLVSLGMALSITLSGLLWYIISCALLQHR